MSPNIDILLLKKLLPEVIDIAKKAGKEIIETAERDINIEHKNDNTPVTNADLAANELIVNSLSKLDGCFNVLSEESEVIDFAQREKWQTYWLVDPLDGTREFIEDNGEYSVNIALIHNNHAILGVIYAPLHGLTYYAYKGSGAYKVDGINSAERICVQSKRRTPVIVTCGNNQPGKEFEAFVKKIGGVEFLAMGSSLKSCLVADGSADIYARLGPTSEWDTAAAQCIVEEAGGAIMDTNMQPLSYNTKDSLLNPYFFVFGDKTENWKQYL